MTRLLNRMWMLLLLLMLTVTTQAQDKSYKECVRIISEINGSSIDAEDLSGKIYTAFATEMQKNGQGTQKDLDELKSLLDKYFKHRFKSDMVNIMVPYYERNVKLDDLNKCVTLMQEPATRAAIEHSQSVLSNQTNLMPGIMAMLTPDFKGLESRMPEDYKKEYDRYLELGNMAGMIESIMGSLGQAAMQGKSEEAKVLMQRMFDNLPVLFGNVLYENHVGIDELRAMNALYGRPEHAGVTKAYTEYTSEIMLVSQKLIGNIVMFISENAQQ